MIAGFGVEAHLPQIFYKNKGGELCSENFIEKVRFIKNKHMFEDILQLIGNQVMGERL